MLQGEKRIARCARCRCPIKYKLFCIYGCCEIYMCFDCMGEIYQRMKIGSVYNYVYEYCFMCRERIRVSVYTKGPDKGEWRVHVNKKRNMAKWNEALNALKRLESL